MTNRKMLQTENNLLGSRSFRLTKRLFDILTCVMLFPFLLFFTFFLFFLNVFFNKGKIYFIQKRMGKNCEPFYAIKFRTMKEVEVISRKYSDPLEKERVTKLGHFLRKTKIDELPQIINVLIGDMSLIGPRPDYYEHAITFLEHDPLYRLRHTIRPGISGLSQIRLGYIEGLNATKRKSKIDLFYINNATIKLDVKILFATLFIILKGFRN